MTCWNNGTGRCSSTTISVRPRTVDSQAPNSSALLTVADSAVTTATLGGSWISTSSQTAAAGPIGQGSAPRPSPRAEALQRAGLLVDHVPEHFGGHHDHRASPLMALSPVSRPTCVAPWRRTSSPNFVLIAQGLDRCGVEGPGPDCSARWTANSPTTVLPLPVGAATSTAACFQRGAGTQLEVVEFERPAGGEGAYRRVALRGAPFGRRVALCRVVVIRPLVRRWRCRSPAPARARRPDAG